MVLDLLGKRGNRHVSFINSALQGITKTEQGLPLPFILCTLAKRLFSTGATTCSNNPWLNHGAKLPRVDSRKLDCRATRLSAEVKVQIRVCELASILHCAGHPP
jgi:hypothetical protein